MRWARPRIYLTYRYRGIWSLLYRALSFPLRFTPLRPYLRLDPEAKHDRTAIEAWYRLHGRPVSVVIPSYRDADQVRALVTSIQRTTMPERVQIIVSDDASGPEHVRALRTIPGIEVIEGTRNEGFAANVNRGLRAATAGHDVVVLNSDTRARKAWLDCLQYAAVHGERVGIVGPKLLYEDHRIQSAGTIRHPDAPEWFDHRYRFSQADSGPANVPMTVLAVTGACMYLTREMLDAVGLFDEEYPMAYEDVDVCLRAWGAGFRVAYSPQAELYHLESATRGMEVGERERASQQVFWKRWGTFFDARPVRSDRGVLRVIYVTEATGVGGGPRDIFEPLKGLPDRGHEV